MSEFIGRKKIWINKFQTQLAVRFSGSLFLYFFCVVNLFFVAHLVTNPFSNPVDAYVEMLRSNATTILIMAVMLPIMAFDLIKFSHRFVGPIVRFRNAVKSLSQGEPVPPIKLREHDYLQEFAVEFNQFLEHIERQGVHVIKPLQAQEEVKQSA